MPAYGLPLLLSFLTFLFSGFCNPAELHFKYVGGCRGTAKPSPCIIYYPPWLDGFTEVKTACLGLRRVLFLIFKIHLYQIIWLSAILAFRFAFSRLHSSGLLHVTGSLANARLRPTKNLAPFHNFYKIVPLRSVFAPVEFSSKTLTSLINCYKQIQN